MVYFLHGNRIVPVYITFYSDPIPSMFQYRHFFLIKIVIPSHKRVFIMSRLFSCLRVFGIDDNLVSLSRVVEKSQDT